MLKSKECLNFKIRNAKVEDLKEIYTLLTANKPFVGLNSRYTYYLLAKDFTDTCIVAEHEGKIVAFSSGYIPPNRRNTLFNWEIVVHKDYRGNGLQKRMLLYQVAISKVCYLEGTVNPSNEVSRNNFRKLARLLNARCEESVLLSEEDFENDGHEAEVLCRIGPFSKSRVEKLLKEVKFETNYPRNEKKPLASFNVISAIILCLWSLGFLPLILDKMINLSIYSFMPVFFTIYFCLLVSILVCIKKFK